MKEKILNRYRKLCSVREYASSDIFSKAIKALDGDIKAAEEIVQTLIEEKFIDDFRYASAYARDKSSIAGWGSTKIRYMLGMKGINKSIIDSALGEIDKEKASLRLKKLLEIKFKSLKNDPDCKQKLIRYGLSRGYSYEDIQPIISQLESKAK